VSGGEHNIVLKEYGAGFLFNVFAEFFAAIGPAQD